MASAFLIIAIALWMLWRTWREQRRLRAAAPKHAHHHDHGHHHVHRDTHELAHADDIRRRFASGNVTTGQIVMFGLGRADPCSAAIAVLVLCLQVNQIWRGVALVFCFSIGLAITLIAAGITAAIGCARFAPLAGFRRACPTPALSLQHRHDRAWTLRRLAGLDERSDRPLKYCVTPHTKPRPPNTPPSPGSTAD